MKSTYILSTNSLRELPQMEKPQDPSEIIGKGADIYFLNAMKAMREYNAHIASLREIPVSGEHNWEDGDVLEEGKDYEVMPPSNIPGCENELYAFPLAVQGEDELWASAIELYLKAKSLYPFSPEKWVSTVQQKYSLTKKQHYP